MSSHERLTELFTQAIELGSEARAALIDRVRADDDKLASELVALLAADAVAATQLRTGGLLSPSPPRAAEPRSSSFNDGSPEGSTLRDPSGGRAAQRVRRDPAARLSIPGYRVQGLLGEGGMGAVYAGEQESPQRPVAIKVLHAASGPALTRFWTEAAIMARLDHPGIARVLESGEADGHPFIVMERVEGSTLDAHVRATSAPVRRRLELFAAMCDAVHHAHLNGVIHRDLKPANVMVRDDGRIAVLDFGIARAATLSGSSPSGSRQSSGGVAASPLAGSGETRAGELIGTPLYMSPEQARLRPDEVDARSDVYSLGVTLHELVAGDLPYDLRDLPLMAVSRIICEEPPRSLRALGFDRDLDAIAGKALAKAPRDRYQSAAALADDVRRYLDGRAVSVRTPGALEQIRRFARRRPAVAAAIAGAVVVTIAFAAVVTKLWLSARAAERIASDARARSEAARAALVARTADLTLQQARSVVARDPTGAMAMLDELRASGTEVPGGAWAMDVVADEARARGIATHTLRGHTDEVHWVVQLADGAVLSAGYDGTLRLWRAPFADSQILFRAARGRLNLAVPSPDGARFAVGGDGGEVHVVDRRGAAVALPGHTGAIERIAWSADGAWLVTGDDRGLLLAWPRGAAPARRLEGPRAQIEAIELSEDGGALVAGDQDGGVYRWDLATWTRTDLPGAKAVRAVWADRDRVAVADAEGTVRRWRGAGTGSAPILDGEVAARVPAKRAIFARGGGAVVFAGIEGSVVRVSLWGGGGGGDGGSHAAFELETLGSHSAKVRGLAIDPTGRRTATGSEDGVVRVWDRETGRLLVLRGHGQRIRHLAFAERGSVLYSADGEGVIRRWALDAIPAELFDGHGAAVDLVALSADARIAASADGDGAVVVADLATGSVRALGKSSAHLTAIALAGHRAVTGDVNGIAAWWGGDQPVRRTLPGAVRAIAATPDGSAIAIGTAAGPIAVFTGDGAPLGTLAGHEGGTEALAFDPSGALLASGGQDRAVRVWRIADLTAGAATPIAELAGFRGDTGHVRFSPRGDLLASGSDDGKVHTWAVRGGAVDAAIDPASFRVVAEHAGGVTALAFDRSGRYLASAARGATLARTELATGATLRIDGHHRAAIGIAVDERGRVLVAREGGTVERWQPPSALLTIPVNASTTSAAALPATGSLLLGGSDGTIRVVHAR